MDIGKKVMILFQKGYVYEGRINTYKERMIIPVKGLRT